MLLLYFVYLGSREVKNGRKAVEQLKAEGLTNVETIQIDVTGQASVAPARVEIGKRIEVLDVLINSAGISGGYPKTALTASIETFKNVYEINVYGVVRCIQVFIDLLRKSPEPRIVNVSSSLGSLTLGGDPSSKYYNNKGVVYPSSKSALNMYTIALAYELRDTSFKVNAVDPGFTKTDFNNHRGTGTVETAASRVAKYALIGNDGPTRKYISEELNTVTFEEENGKTKMQLRQTVSEELAKKTGAYPSWLQMLNNMKTMLNQN